MTTLRRRLEDELREISRRLDGHQNDDGDRGHDEGDVAAAGHNHDVSIDERQRLTEKAQAIRLALGRIDSGQYGRCQDCGQRIGPSRLEALPYAETCIDCARLREAMALADEPEAGIRREYRPPYPLDELGQ